MKRKTNPIHSELLMLHTDPLDFYLDDNLHRSFCIKEEKFSTVKTQLAVIGTAKSSQDTIDNKTKFLKEQYKDQLYLEYAREHGHTLRYQYKANDPIAAIDPVVHHMKWKNEPISDIKVIGIGRYHGNALETLVCLPGNFLATIDHDILTEAVARGDVVRGVLKCDFIWASLGRLKLIRFDSPVFKSLVNGEI